MVKWQMAGLVVLIQGRSARRLLHILLPQRQAEHLHPFPIAPALVDGRYSRRD